MSRAVKGRGTRLLNDGSDRECPESYATVIPTIKHNVHHPRKSTAARCVEVAAADGKQRATVVDARILFVFTTSPAIGCIDRP